MIECEREFWLLRRLGFEVTGGIGHVASRMRKCPGIHVKYFNELAVYHGDLIKIPKVYCILLPIKRPGFSLRALWIRGYPHLSPEDFIESFIDSLNRYYRDLAQTLLKCITQTSENRRISSGNLGEVRTLRM